MNIRILRSARDYRIEASDVNVYAVLDDRRDPERNRQTLSGLE